MCERQILRRKTSKFKLLFKKHTKKIHLKYCKYLHIQMSRSCI